jgi:hypothetical protein
VYGQQHLHVPAWPAAASACCAAVPAAVMPIGTGNRLVNQSSVVHTPVSMFKTGSSPATAAAAPAAAVTDADSSGDDTDLEEWDYYKLSRQVCTPIRKKSVLPSPAYKTKTGSCNM